MEKKLDTKADIIAKDLANEIRNAFGMQTRAGAIIRNLGPWAFQLYRAL